MRRHLRVHQRADDRHFLVDAGWALPSPRRHRLCAGAARADRRWPRRLRRRRSAGRPARRRMRSTSRARPRLRPLPHRVRDRSRRRRRSSGAPPRRPTPDGCRSERRRQRLGRRGLGPGRYSLLGFRRPHSLGQLPVMSFSSTRRPRSSEPGRVAAFDASAVDAAEHAVIARLDARGGRPTERCAMPLAVNGKSARALRTLALAASGGCSPLGSPRSSAPTGRFPSTAGSCPTCESTICPSSHLPAASRDALRRPHRRGPAVDAALVERGDPAPLPRTPSSRRQRSARQGQVPTLRLPRRCRRRRLPLDADHMTPVVPCGGMTLAQQFEARSACATLLAERPAMLFGSLAACRAARRDAACRRTAASAARLGGLTRHARVARAAWPNHTTLAVRRDCPFGSPDAARLLAARLRARRPRGARARVGGRRRVVEDCRFEESLGAPLGAAARAARLPRRQTARRRRVNGERRLLPPAAPRPRATCEAESTPPKPPGPGARRRAAATSVSEPWWDVALALARHVTRVLSSKRVDAIIADVTAT